MALCDPNISHDYSNTFDISYKKILWEFIASCKISLQQPTMNYEEIQIIKNIFHKILGYSFDYKAYNDERYNLNNIIHETLQTNDIYNQKLHRYFIPNFHKHISWDFQNTTINIPQYTNKEFVNFINYFWLRLQTITKHDDKEYTDIDTLFSQCFYSIL